MNNAFELDAMDDKTNLVAVIFPGCSSSIGFLLGIPEHHMGPGVFFAVCFRRMETAGVTWDTNPVVWNNILEHLELCLEKDKEMVRTFRRARRFHLSWESPDL